MSASDDAAAADGDTANGGTANGGTAPRLDLIANARMPSQRAQSLQVAQMAAAFQAAGARTRLLYAQRFPTPALPDGVNLWQHYGVPDGPRPAIEAVPCVDWIDRSPRRLQFGPARLQEWTFAKHAAERSLAEPAADLVLSREVESALHLVRAGHPGVFLEVHRVPGGATRRRWLRSVAEGARGLVAISGGVRDDLVKHGADPASIVVEHDGVALERFDGRLTVPAARAAIDVPTDEPLVVYTGGLLEWKGVDILVDAARRLPEVRFVIAGGMDADVQRLREYARGLSNVRCDGFQSPDRVINYLVAGDVGVVPNRSYPPISARYTSPLKVFEYLAAGLPMVVSDLPSMRDILDPASEAVFVEPDSPTALAAGIRRLIDDRHLGYHLAKRGRLRARRHSWRARARRLLEWMGERAAPGAERGARA